MRVVISGATGFIGRALCRALFADYEVVALSRNPGRAAHVVGDYARVVPWDAQRPQDWAECVEGARAIVNLAGENVASGRWTTARKQRIRQSRTQGAHAILDAVRAAANKPGVVIQASAIGYYGSQGDEVLDESAPAGTGFLAEVCRETESVAAGFDATGVRCVIIRTGVVLGTDGGALPRLAKPFRFYAGGWIGSGRQWFSWIALADEIRAIRFLMETEGLTGAFNLTAPHPVTMKEFSRTLGATLHRPAWATVPGFAARLIFGQVADEMLLASQRVLPRRLTQAGFSFQYPEAKNALATIMTGEETNESC